MQPRNEIVNILHLPSGRTRVSDFVVQVGAVEGVEGFEKPVVCHVEGAEDVGLDAEARRTAYHSRPVLAHTVASLNHRHIIHLGNKHSLQITV